VAVAAAVVVVVEGLRDWRSWEWEVWREVRAAMILEFWAARSWDCSRTMENDDVIWVVSSWTCC